MSRRTWVILAGWVWLGVVAGPSAADEPDVARWTLSAVVAGASAGSLLVEAGVDCWTFVGDQDRRLYPTWLSVQSVDGAMRHREARLDRVSWMSWVDADDVIVRNTRLVRTPEGWTLETSHPDFSLSLELRLQGPSLDVDDRTVHPVVLVTGHVKCGSEREAVSGDGRIEVSQEAVADLRSRAGQDALTFRTAVGGTVVIIRERDRRFGHTTRVRGIYAGARGAVLDLDDLNLSFYPLGTSRWTSSATGAEFPIRWRLNIPALGLRCEIEPVRDDQEIDGTAAWGSSLWRGPVRVFGWRHDVPVDTRGTLELAGYGESFPPRAFLAERDISPLP